MDIPQDTILVVDDEATVLNFCKLILTRSGFAVVEARNGEEALRQVPPSGSPIRLALIDVVMPGMNGFELAKQIRRRAPRMEILLMSGYSVSEVKNIAGGDHPYRVMWKPFKADSLVRMIQTVLDNVPRHDT
ncbi:MAG TPA: response regulator [Bryobacteraceae bacterium]|jgi:DNA-binding NtrC family response regulator